MKIAIYGDSYADADLFEGNAWSTNYSWPKLLQSYYSNYTVDFYATSGTSAWWSYEKFFKTHTQYEKIIFCYAGTSRWPYLPEYLEGRHFDIYGHEETVNIYKQHSEKFTDMMDISRLFDTVYSQNLLNFINSKIFDDINNMCLYNGIQLINVITTAKESYYQRHNYDYPVVENLINVSAKETVTVNNKQHNIHELMIEQGNPDVRYCHLNPKNNRVLAETFINLFTYPKNVLIDAESIQGWEYQDPLMDLYYQSLN
jgi:hypothetical protein